MKRLYLLCVILVMAGVSNFGWSQFYQVYGYTTLDASEKELVLWNTYIPLSNQTYSFFGEDVNRQGLFAHSLEVEYGLTSNLTLALYADFEHPAGESIKWIRTKAVMFHYSFFDKGYLPLDFALYGEYKLPRKGYKNYEELEFKLIMEKDIGSHQFVANPTVEKKISGHDAGEHVEFAFNAAYTYIKSLAFQPRLEYYSKMGALYDLPGFDEQKHYIFPSISWFFGKYGQFRWHAGVGFGLTNPTDKLIIKSKFSYEFF